MPGRIMRVDRKSGKILGAMESPGNLIFTGSLTGNVLRWYPGWLTKGLGPDEGLTPGR